MSPDGLGAAPRLAIDGIARAAGLVVSRTRVGLAARSVTARALTFVQGRRGPVRAAPAA